MSGLPRRPRGRPNGAINARYEEEIKTFCGRILEIRSRLDFEVGSRGWCYLLEGEGVITKGEFDAAERLICQCRKDGNLPIDIAAEDHKRATSGVERLDSPDIESEAAEIVACTEYAHFNYTPISFWEDLDVYVEIAVEKGDLRSLFERVAGEFKVPIQNIGGWADLNVRAGMMRRFQRWEAKDKQCILLNCGDHDPGGLSISQWLLSNLKDLERAVGWSPDNLIIERFGLDYDFIESNNLTWIDNLQTGSGGDLADAKHPDHRKSYVQDYLARFSARKVEANALVARPDAGRELCRQAILRWVPDDAVPKYRERLREVREELRQAIARRLSR